MMTMMMMMGNDVLAAAAECQLTAAQHRNVLVTLSNVAASRCGRTLLHLCERILLRRTCIRG